MSFRVWFSVCWVAWGMVSYAGPPSLPEAFLQAAPGVYSGGEPRGEADFEALAKQGIQTVVSVDAARPDLEAASKHGIRYIHLPIGYDGIPENAQLGLARLMKEREGPVYIHCHHGHHRGPAATALACRVAGLMDGPMAERYMSQAGTSPDYAGLWRDVREFSPPAEGTPLPELVSVSPTGALADQMASLDRHWDILREMEALGWAPLARHPDVSPARQALLIREGFQESLRQLPEDAPEALREGMSESHATAVRMEAALKTLLLENASNEMRLLKKQCSDCHKAHRN